MSLVKNEDTQEDRRGCADDLSDDAADERDPRRPDLVLSVARLLQEIEITVSVHQRVLIVEDEAPIRELIRLHLSLAGFA